LFALAFIPTEQVVQTFEDLLIDERSVAVIQHFPAIQNICNYYYNTWLHGQYPMEMWNVYDVGEIRTNNNIEGWHRYVRELFGKHAMLYNFIVKLHEVQKMEEVWYEKVRAGNIRAVQDKR
jgi:hypothetical protein